MKKLILNCFLALLTFFCSCQHKTNNPLQTILNQSESDVIKKVIADLDTYEVQILLSEVHKNNGKVTFTDYSFNVNDSTYFYPASTVKFPVSVLLLEELSFKDFPTINTPFFVEGDTIITTFKKDITDIFAVSSNDTFNRLFEYLSKDTINSRLAQKGLLPIRISHRLSTDNAADLKTKNLVFYKNDTTLISTNSVISKPIKPLHLNKIKKGAGFYQNGELVNEPMDFSLKNYLPINTLHGIMKRVIFPEAFPANKQFKLSKVNRDFLLNAMQIVPRNAGYNETEYYDSYGKFFMYGDTKERIPDHIKIYNKVGYAYGYLTDCAYITDTKNNLEFILTATIHVNKDGIFNDDVYEYDEIGIPFLAQIGREIHEFLLSQRK